MQHPGSIKSYTTGFILSIALTIIPYLIVVNAWLRGSLLVAVLLGFAVLQLYVQLVFFLHMGRSRDQRWNLVAFLFMVLVVLIVVIGSLWIMNNLNYHMMKHPEKIDQQLIEGEGIPAPPHSHEQESQH